MESTKRPYLQQVGLYAKYFERSPTQLGPQEVRDYQVYLTLQLKLSAASVGIAISALRFLCKVTLKQDWKSDEIPMPTKPLNIRRDAAARFGPEHRRRAVGHQFGSGGRQHWRRGVDGLQRVPINVRYPRETRDSLKKLRSLPIVTECDLRLMLSDLTDVRVTDGTPMPRSENARLSGWVYVDIRGRDLRSAVQDMQAAVVKQVALPSGFSISWSRQFEFLERATARLKLVVQFTLMIILVLLYLTFNSWARRY